MISSQKNFCYNIKTDGSCLVEPKFEGAGDFKNGYAWVELKGKEGYIDTSGNWHDELPESPEDNEDEEWEEDED